MSKLMRIFVMFDLPTKTKVDKDNYIKFRRYLIQSGYTMLQYSIYTKICNGHDSANRWAEKLKANLPTSGQVRVLVITNNQFDSMLHLIGNKTEQEEFINGSQITFL